MTPYYIKAFVQVWKRMSNFYWLIIKLSIITCLLGFVQVTKLCPFLLSFDHWNNTFYDYIVYLDQYCNLVNGPISVHCGET